MLEEDSLVELQSLFPQHVERSCVAQLRSLLQQIPSNVFIRLYSQTVAVHVTQVDHRIAVLQFVGVEEVLIGLFVAAFDQVWNAVEIDSSQVDHGIRVVHFSCFQVAADCQLPVLLDSVSTEVAIANLVLGWGVVAL
jgi:hypothetical protein